MDRIWIGVKRFCKWYVIVCWCCWLVTWALASYDAGRMLGLDQVGWNDLFRAALH
jgi:hypothetical protein